MNWPAILEALGPALSFLGTLLAGAGVVWAFFRKRLRVWWAPYRAGIDGMADLPEMHKSIDKLQVNVSVLAMQMRARGDINIEAAEFEADATGAVTYVNLTYARWLGVGKGELLGWGWVNFLHPEDRNRVRFEWDECRKQHRVFNLRYRIVSIDNETITVDALITPIPEAPPARSWIGVMRRVVT